MHFLQIPVDYEDVRGKISDLLNESIDSITRIGFSAGAIRGNHVHKETVQWTYVTKGELIIATVLDGEQISRTAFAGDFFVSLPGEPHAMRAVTESEILVFTRGPRSGQSYHDDTYKFDILS